MLSASVTISVRMSGLNRGPLPKRSNRPSEWGSSCPANSWDSTVYHWNSEELWRTRNITRITMHHDASWCIARITGPSGASLPHQLPDTERKHTEAFHSFHHCDMGSPFQPYQNGNTQRTISEHISAYLSTHAFGWGAAIEFVSIEEISELLPPWMTWRHWFVSGVSSVLSDFGIIWVWVFCPSQNLSFWIHFVYLPWIAKPPLPWMRTASAGWETAQSLWIWSLGKELQTRRV